MIEASIEPGVRVRVTQQIPFGQTTRTTQVEGVVLRAGQQKTGSWFAHARDKKLWLDRLELRKADGEVIVINLDQYSRVEAIVQ
jgi:hypothetical protein